MIGIIPLALLAFGILAIVAVVGVILFFILKK